MRGREVQLGRRLGDGAVGAPQLDLGHRRAREVLEHAVVAAGPLARLVVDRAQRAEPHAVGGGQRHAEVGDDPVFLDRRVVADLRVRARVDDLQRRAGLHDVAAERVRERRLAQLADADRGLEHLALGGDEREQRDGDVQHLGDQPRDAVERRLGRRVEQAALGQRREPARIGEAVGHGSSARTIDATSVGPALALVGVLGRLEGGDLDADDVALARDVGQQRRAGRCRSARSARRTATAARSGSSTSRSRCT